MLSISFAALLSHLFTCSDMRPGFNRNNEQSSKIVLFSPPEKIEAIALIFFVSLDKSQESLIFCDGLVIIPFSFVVLHAFGAVRVTDGYDAGVRG